MKKKMISLAAAAALVISSVSLASALTITNGSFETGDFTGWFPAASTGSTTVVTTTNASSGNVYNPTDGNYFAKLDADSALLQLGLSWEAGEKIGFNWAFLAFDYLPFNDFALVTLAGSTTQDSFVFKLSDVAAVGDYGDTGWQSFVHTFQNSGNGLITFGSLNLLDQINSSALLVDNVTNNPAPVPEPGTMILFGAGLLGLAIFGKRKMNKV